MLNSKISAWNHQFSIDLADPERPLSHPPTLGIPYSVAATPVDGRAFWWFPIL